MRLLTFVAFLLFTSLSALAQNGDRAGETQRELPPEWELKARNALSPKEALAEFVLPQGYEIQLVAAEPLVQAPIQIAFDADGSLWVLEMRGYMPDADGTDEQSGAGRVSHLYDTNNDGVMDRSVVFLENLVLPRAIAPTHDGLLIVEPPNVLYARDTSGDGVADEISIVVSGFAGLKSPEHAGNGLRYGIDNVFETSQHTKSFWFDGENITSRRVGAHGQWGITRDDYGRLFYSPNSDPLIGDRYPKHYAARNPETRGLDGVPERYAHDKRTWPVHMTPGVNRGYNASTLRKDGTLAKFTAACGPEIFRGEALGLDAYGDAFVCETVGNLVKQYDLAPSGESIKATQVFENREFLASNDERFRPVNLLTGPDGALYIVDMYRGVVQHKIFMTSWLRKQVEARGLELPIDRGRIWRVVKKDVPLTAIEDLSVVSLQRLVEVLATSPNGTVRDTAQRLLVEHQSHEPVEALSALALNTNVDDYRRIQSAWTLHGLDAIDFALVEALSRAVEAPVRAASARLAEALQPSEGAEVIATLLRDEVPTVRMQALLSAGELPDFEAFIVFDGELANAVPHNALRKAIYSGLAGREVAFVEANNGWLATNGAAQRRVIKDLVDALLKRQGNGTALMALVSERCASAPWQAMVLLDAVASYTRAGTKKARTLRLNGEPRAWSEHLHADNGRVATRAMKIDAVLRWPRREGYAPRADTSPSGIIARGKRLYGHCLSCHQPNGRGLPPIYPPLDESDFVNGSPERLASILLHGLEGRITVQGQTYNQSMPPAPLKSDADVAAVMSYIRQAWNNIGDPVDAAFVKGVREAIQSHRGPWTATDLETAMESLGG